MPLSTSGKEPEVDIGEAVADLFHRPRPKSQTFRHHFQAGPQFGLALLDPVSKLAAVEGRQTWAGKLAPGVPLQRFQGVYLATQIIRLSHAVGPIFRRSCLGLYR